MEGLEGGRRIAPQDKVPTTIVSSAVNTLSSVGTQRSSGHPTILVSPGPSGAFDYLTRL